MDSRISPRLESDISNSKSHDPRVWYSTCKEDRCRIQGLGLVGDDKNGSGWMWVYPSHHYPLKNVP